MIDKLLEAIPEGHAGCCCHGLDAPCDFDWKDRHVHKCLPEALDLEGHCPDAGCAGRCWERQA